MQNLALFISRGGTTATAIINACKPGGPLYAKIRPVLVVASKSGIAGIGRVAGTSLLDPKDIVVISPSDFQHADGSINPDAFGTALIEECQKRNVTLFGQYGWIVKTPQNFLRLFLRGVNQHPAPLCAGQPDFGGKRMYGKRCHLAVLLFRRFTKRDFWTKVVAHRVTEGYDEGAVLKERKIPILQDDDADALAARTLPVEHEIQIETLLDFANATVTEVTPEPLVFPHEKVLWEISRQAGIYAYPNG